MSRRATALLFTAIAVASGVLTAWLLPRTEAPPPAPAPSAAKATRAALSPLSTSRSSRPALTPDARAALLEEIEDMAVQYDARVLPRLEPLLSHHDAEVRAAAAQGIVTLGETAGAALLRKAALTAPTPEEAVRLKSQAGYLELPSAVPEASAQ
jgi:HEAT repeats